MFDKKGPKTIKGQMRKMVTGDGRVNPKIPESPIKKVDFDKKKELKKIR
ncbi:hypothetical protein BMS3Bbin16_00142 [archaeon BMS3Bbin16]|nr:hypothetical protein BMS3Bbin16_00142 [archaeon BMS3Bbin16]